MSAVQLGGGQSGADSAQSGRLERRFEVRLLGSHRVTNSA